MKSIITISILAILCSCGKPSSSSNSLAPNMANDEAVLRIVQIESEYSLEIEYTEDGSLKAIQCNSPCSHSWMTEKIDFKMTNFENNYQRVIISIDGKVFENKSFNGYYDYRYVL